MALDEAPPFWWHKRAWQAWALWPASYVYGRLSARRMMQEPTASVDAPVICVGNFVAGGAGKTPTVLSLGKTAIEQGYKPGFLSRGFGGAIHHATVVDLSKHNSHDVGDEALVLADLATTVVSPDRVVGAQMLVSEGCDLIIMDDGFQNPHLAKDYCLVVTDSERGLGNGHTIPGGPMRAPLLIQFQKTDGVLIIGDGDGADDVIRKVARSAKPLFQAFINYENAEYWKDKWVCAYAGIGNPDKFFKSLTKLGAEVVDRHAFGDHHRFHDDECHEMIAKAKLMKAELVTTQKDAARLKGMGDVQSELLAASHVLKINLEFEISDAPKRIIRKAVERYKKRRLKRASEL